MKRDQILTAVPSRLSNHELDEFISGVMAERFRLHNHGNIQYSVSYFTDLLHIAVAEQNSRSSKRLMQWAIGISFAAVLVSTLSLGMAWL